MTPKNITKLIALLVAFYMLLFSLESHAAQFKCTRVTDGDTIKFTNNGTTSTIRLVGIDAPELSRKKHGPGQPYSKKSTKFLASLVLNKTVDINSYGEGWYGRTLGVVFVDGMNVNLEMVKQGLAEVYRGRPAKGFEMNPIIMRKPKPEKQSLICGLWVINI